MWILLLFLSPEASRAVNNYLEYRARTDDTKDERKIRHLEKQKVFSDDGYLFVKRKIPDKYLKKS